MSFNGQLPYALDAERAVNGSLLIELNRGVLANLSPDDFYNRRQRDIFQAIRETHRAGYPVDAATVATKIPDFAGDIGLCLEACGHVERAEHYAGLLKSFTERRRRIAEAKRMEAEARDTSKPIDLPEQRKRLQLIDSQTLDRMDLSTEYHVEGVLAKHQQCIAAGSFKAMKTTGMIDLALSVSAGLPFLEKFFTKRCKVGFFCGESGGATVQETARRIAKTKGMPLGNFDVHWCFELPQIHDPSDLQIVEDDIRRLGLELAIIDPAYLSLGLSENGAGNLFSVGAKLLPLTKLQQDTGCTIVLVHHTKRGVVNPFDPPELADIAWAGFAEWARQWILFGRRTKYDAELGGYHELWLNYGGSAGHSGLWALNINEGTRQDPGGRVWEVEVLKASSARADAAEDERERKQAEKDQKRDSERAAARKRITDTLKAAGKEGDTKTGIRDRCGINTSRFNEVFAEMLADGSIEKLALTKGNNRQYEGYRIATGRNRTQPDKKSPSGCPDAIASERDNPPIGGVRPVPDAIAPQDGLEEITSEDEFCPDANLEEITITDHGDGTRTWEG